MKVRCAACNVTVQTQGQLRAHWMSDEHLKNLGPWQKKEAEQEKKKSKQRKGKKK